MKVSNDNLWLIYSFNICLCMRLHFILLSTTELIHIGRQWLSAVVHLGCLQTRRLVVQSLVPPDQVQDFWMAAPDELDDSLHG